MKMLKKLSLMVAAVAMVAVVGGCSNSTNKEEIIDANNFNVIYAADKEVDKVIFSVGDFEHELTPMHNDTKLKEGYKFNGAIDEIEGDLSIQVIDDGKVIYEKSDEKIDLTEKKKVDVKIVSDKDGNLDVEIIKKNK